MNGIHKIKRKIAKADVVSFDVFDTLIKRNVMKPSDLFVIVGNEFERKTGIPLGDYKAKRIFSEQKARNKSGKEEVTINEIFNHMEGISEKNREKLKFLEIDMEIRMSCPSHEMQELYFYALSLGKKIIITSDMYLEKAQIEKLLKKNGYTGYERIYVSSDLGICKRSGNLYGYILNDMKIDAGRMVHIGDNIRSDWKRAKEKGIVSCLIPGRKMNLTYWKRGKDLGKDMNWKYSVIKAFLNNHIQIKDTGKLKDYAERIGFEVLGPLLAGYTVWLKKEADEINAGKIFFLSREGKILQRAYRVMFPECTIPQSYLYVSRQSVLVPLLASVENFDELIDVLKNFMRTPELKTVRILCSLDEKEFKDQLEKIGLEENTSVYGISNKEEVFSIIRELGLNWFRQQKEYLLTYLEREHFEGNVILADIGWTGTMQNALHILYGGEEYLHMTGGYLGVRNMQKNDKYDGMHRLGYLFDPFRNVEFDYMTRFTNEVLELMFLNGDGSVRGYYNKEGEIFPLFAEREFTCTCSKFIHWMQKSAMKFVGLYAGNWEVFEKLDISPEVMFQGYINFAVYPRRKTIRIFSKFRYRDEKIKPLVPNRSLLYYMTHSDKLKWDMENGCCKVFMMKKLFMFPLPYHKLLRFLVEKLHWKSEFRRTHFEVR